MTELRGVPDLFRVDRLVWVETPRVLPPNSVRQDELPMWVKAYGLRLEPRLCGTQTAMSSRMTHALGAVDSAVGGFVVVVSPNKRRQEQDDERHEDERAVRRHGFGSS